MYTGLSADYICNGLIIYRSKYIYRDTILGAILMTGDKRQELALGYKTAEPIYSRDGHLLLSEGTVISYEILSKLKKHNINYYQTLMELQEETKGEDLIDEATMTSSVNVVKSVFEEVMAKDDKGVKPTIPDDYIQLVTKVIEEIMDILYGSEDLLYTVTELIKSDDYTYRHSVNVTILSILTAKKLGYTELEIKEIALGALLHDIGKALVKDGLIQKEARLSPDEEAEIKRHPELGYKLVKDMDSLPESVKQIILLHHEKLDGSGYPRGITGLSIPKYVRLVTVCDMYDAMTTNRQYRKKMPIYTALEILMKDAVYKIDADIYRKMSSTICIYPHGQGVLLSDGRIGVISYYRHQNPTRPIVKVIDYNLSDRHVDVQDIDLLRQRTLFIIDTWHLDDFKSGYQNLIDKDTFNDLSDKEKNRFSKNIG